MAEPTIDERVQAGAAWLDENVPGWVERIDLDLLRISSCTSCVLGQLFGSFSESPVPARWSGPNVLDADWVAASRGFDIPDSDTGYYAGLTEAWKQLITSRRAVTV